MKKKFIIPAVLLLIFSGCGEVTNTDHVHDLSYHSKVNATCTENGHEAYFECLECHKLFSDEMAENEIESPAETIATGHGDNLHHFDAVPGTCLDVGVKEFYECYSCDRIYSDAEGKNQIEAPESSGYGYHQLKYVAEVPGGCATYATAAHYQCTLCEKLFTDEAGKNETKIEDLYTGSLTNHAMTYNAGSPKTNFVDGIKAHYECSNCHNLFEDAEGKKELSKDQIHEKSDAWVRFGFSTSTNNGVKCEDFAMKDKIFDENKDIYGSKITFGNALAAGSHFIHDTNGHNASANGVNPRIRLIGGKNITYKMYIKNTGVGDLKLSICFNDTNDNSGILVDVKQGQEVTLSDSINHYHNGTRGGWIKVIAKGDIQKGASYEAYGYYKSSDYLDFDGINNTFKVQSEAKKKSFLAGEKFTSEGLMLRMYEDKCSSNTDTGYVTSYETNYDGHTFTNDDVGTKTVYVKFGSVTLSYDIEVKPYHDKCSLTLVKGLSATNWSNGTSDYYACSICDKIYSDANGQNLTTYDQLRESKGAWARFTNYKGVSGSGVTASYVDVEDKIFGPNRTIKGTKVKFTSAMNNGSSFDHQNNFDDDALKDRTNSRIPFATNQTLDLKFYYENTGTSAISFKYRLWDGQSSTEIIEFSLQPGESKLISKTFDNPANLNNLGGWARFIATSNIASGSEFVSYGYISTTNHNFFDFTGSGTGVQAKLSIKQQSSKTTFKVGETFTTQDLILLVGCSLPNAKHGGMLVYDFDTNYDGHTFTSADIGTKTVTVRFADGSVTYNIKVEA